MKVTSIRVKKITVSDNNLFRILDKYLPKIEEKSVVAITSKIVSICEGRVTKIDNQNKKSLIKKESSLFLSERNSRYGFILTIKNGLLIPSAGIDESNGNNYYVLWPSDPQKSVNQIREYLRKRFKLKSVGVIMTDSKTTPLRWGTTGVCLAYSGFYGLNNFIGKPDLFGREMKVTKVNVADGLAATAVLTMGESNEQTPLAIISDVPFIRFNHKNPSRKELTEFSIKIEDDLYAPLLTSVKWKKGESKKNF